MLNPTNTCHCGQPVSSLATDHRGSTKGVWSG